MKYRDFVKELENLGFTLDRHGSSHDIFKRGNETETVPRHREINEILARKIIRKAKKKRR